jgi:hypothetical protein
MLKKIGVGVSITVLSAFLLYGAAFMAQGDRFTELLYTEAEASQMEMIDTTYVRQDVYRIHSAATQRQLDRIEKKLDRLLEQ